MLGSLCKTREQDGTHVTPPRAAVPGLTDILPRDPTPGRRNNDKLL